MVKIYFYRAKHNDKIAFKNLDKIDKKRVKNSPNLAQNKNFIASRILKNKIKKKNLCISHKMGFACAINSKFFGLDMEILKPRNFSAAVDFCFNEKEKEFFEKSEDKMLTFYKIFTAKEAILKLLNLNFADFKKVSFFDEKFTKFYILKDEFLICAVAAKSQKKEKLCKKLMF